jgi:hypothetical protein
VELVKPEMFTELLVEAVLLPLAIAVPWLKTLLAVGAAVAAA